MDRYASIVARIPTLGLLRVLVDSAYYYNIQFLKDFPNTPRASTFLKYGKEERQKLVIFLESNNSIATLAVDGFEDIKTVDRLLLELEKAKQQGINFVREDCEGIAALWCAEETIAGRKCKPEIILIENEQGERTLHAWAKYEDGISFDVSLMFGMPPAREGEIIKIIDTKGK